jgi:ankyrin repeat protein
VATRRLDPLIFEARPLKYLKDTVPHGGSCKMKKQFLCLSLLVGVFCLELFRSSSLAAQASPEEFKVVDYILQEDLPQVKTWIKSGANINARFTFFQWEGYTPLMVAAMSNNNNKIVKLLINEKADVNTRTKHGTTALIYASQNTTSGSVDIVRTLLKAKADSNAKDAEGKTALMYAAENRSSGSIDIVKALLRANANAKAQDKTGKTPLAYAVESNGYPGIVTALIKKGVDVNAKDSDGTPLIVLAAQKCQYSYVFEELLAARPRADVKDRQGKTALDVLNPKLEEKRWELNDLYYGQP